MRTVRSFWLFAVALVAVVAWALAVSPHGATQGARIAHLESLVRCPSCEDLSVAQSNATSAVAVRHEIAREVRAGRSDTQILTSLEAVYGSGILLSPPTTGLGALLYLVPLVGVATLVLVLARLWRRRR